ncbi:REF/SRPP-like protein, partial [Tanacetum coccineum]
IESEQERLKYLEFVQVALLHALLYASKVYCYAKENSGPLKPGVETIEGTLKTVVGPAYDKFHDVPVEVLKFVDRKLFLGLKLMENGYGKWAYTEGESVQFGNNLNLLEVAYPFAFLRYAFNRSSPILASLNVKILTLPVADEAGSMWTKKFGFEKIPDVEVCISIRHLLYFTDLVDIKDKV